MPFFKYSGRCPKILDYTLDCTPVVGLHKCEPELSYTYLILELVWLYSIPQILPIGGAS